MNSATCSQAQSILITGATGAIGGALALAYATPNHYLILHGRRQETLERLAERCRDLGAEVTTSSANLTDSQALAEWLTNVNKRNLPDIAILNAGQNTHPAGAGQLESLEHVTSLININLKTPIAMSHHLVPAMRERGSRLVGRYFKRFGTRHGLTHR